MVGRDPVIGHAFFAAQHPDDNIRHTVLRLFELNRKTKT